MFRWAWEELGGRKDDCMISEIKGQLVHSHWSRLVGAELSLVQRFRVLKYFHSVATAALLCHKVTAQGTQRLPEAWRHWVP